MVRASRATFGKQHNCEKCNASLNGKGQTFVIAIVMVGLAAVWWVYGAEDLWVLVLAEGWVAGMFWWTKRHRAGKA